MAKTKEKKKPVDYNSKLYIGNEMKAFDSKDYNYYDSLDEEEKKKFSPFILFRWGSCVYGEELGQFYTVASNEFANVNLWDLSKHKKLQWLTLCTISPGIGNQKHYWLGTVKKESNKLKNQLLELLPKCKSSDIDLIMKVNSEEEIMKWLESNGLDPEKVKK
jgi:hypothetical protein